MLDDRLEPVGGDTYPLAHGLPGEFDPVARAQDRLLPVERQVVHVLLDQNVRDQTRTGEPALHQARRQRRHDGRQGAVDLARELPTDDAATEVARGRDIEFLGDFFADALIGRGVLLHRLGIDHDLLGRQVLRQARLAVAWRTRRCGRLRRVVVVIRRHDGRVAQQQFQLAGIDLLACAAEQALDQELHLLLQQMVL